MGTLGSCSNTIDGLWCITLQVCASQWIIFLCTATLSHNFGIDSSALLLLNGLVCKRWFISPILGFLSYHHEKKKLWSGIAHVVIWSMWMKRNRRVFQDVGQDIDGLRANTGKICFFGLQNCKEYKNSRFVSSLLDCSSLLDKDIGCTFDYHTIFFADKKKKIRTLTFIILHLLNSHMIENEWKREGLLLKNLRCDCQWALAHLVPPTPEFLGKK